MVSEYLPVLEEIAREQAGVRFAGNYNIASNISSNVSSSISIATDDEPGLVITSWMYDGHDIINETIPAIFQSGPLNGLPRLYPSGLEEDGEVAWIAHFELQGDGLRIFSEACTDWEGLDVLQYGDVGLDDVVFRVGDDGNARSVELRGWRVVLEKE